MYVCASCDKVIESGVFPPGEDADFVCEKCFRARHPHAPMPEGTRDTAQVTRYGVRHRPGHRPTGKKIVYSVVVSTARNSQVLRKLRKRNLLTLRNLPPGSYTVGY